jgi:hypothetical protein
VVAGLVPAKPAQLVFKALQTYSSGEIVRWIQIAAAGQPKPDFPAPVLTLTSGATSTVATTSHSANPASRGADSSSGAQAIAIVALAMAAISLVGLLWVARRYRARDLPGGAP